MAFSSPHFKVTEAGPGVFALLEQGTGACISNAAVIDLGDRTIVVDTFMTLAAGDDLVAAVKALTGRDAFLAVNTHWHDDHTGGNQLLGPAPIVSTRRTTELIAANGIDDPAAYAAEIEEYLQWAKGEEEAAETPEDQMRAARARQAAELLLAGRDRFRLTLPSVFIDDRMVVKGSDREVEILTYGGGHTESDVFVNVAAEGIIIGGDLIWVEHHPRTKDGDPGAWARILERMSTLAPGHLVPGHGPLIDGSYLGVLATYLDTVAETIVTASDLDGEAIARLAVPAGSENWRGDHNFVDGIRTLTGA